jgi:two-component system, OmpR family, phosphate regulon sensor histidine kinase PhoR
MKKRNSILLLGILTIIIIISAQVIIIRGVWKQKDEMLYMRYRMLSQEAVASLRGQRSVDVFDTVRFILNRYSEQIIKELPQIKDEQELSVKKKEILIYFSKVLNQEQDLSGFLSTYFEKMGFEKDFKHRIEINYLDIIGSDTIKIYQNGNFVNRSPVEHDEISSSLKGPRSSILVNWFHLEDNYYSLEFDYKIDFSDKQKMILKETFASLCMSIFSIIVVVIIFMITYRNLMEEKRLSNLKTDFINNMTHELKTPLATIAVAGKTLEMEQIRTNEGKILETAKLIGKQSVHLNQLINMFLEISMWERTQFQLDKKYVDVGELLDDVIDSFIPGSGKEAIINKKHDLSGIKANIDVVYFTTMINNLISNSVKYSDKDPIIDIEGFIANSNICIRVSDNGIGINKCDQKHIFDKFYRASTGNIHKFKGLGLGLYYVKKIAEAHCGDVTVSSKPGKGSTFTITIPH